MFDEIIDSIKSNKMIMIVFVIILSYFVLRMFYMGEEKIIEGLSNNKSMEEQLETMNKNIEKANSMVTGLMQMDKYKSDYENIIISLDNFMDNMVVVKVLTALSQPKAKLDPSSVITPQLMSEINDMVKFKENLESVMDSLDKASASSSSGSSSSSSSSSFF